MMLSSIGRSLDGEARELLPRLHLAYLPRGSMTAGSGGARSQIVLNYGVLAPLCDPILGRVPI